MLKEGARGDVAAQSQRDLAVAAADGAGREQRGLRARDGLPGVALVVLVRQEAAAAGLGGALAGVHQSHRVRQILCLANAIAAIGRGRFVRTPLAECTPIDRTSVV